MSRWFRFYSDALRKPKVARLADKDFRLWVELLAVAAENDGAIPCLDDLKHLLKRRLDHLSTAVKRLISTRLIVQLNDGYEPYGWAKYQYKSDTSTERVAKHRQKCNVSVTPPDTDTDTDTDIKEPKGSKSLLLKPVDLGSQIWSDWERVRKKPITQTVMVGVEREAAKAGISVSAAITHAAENSWQSFKAEWIKEKSNGGKFQSSGGAGPDKRDGFTRILDEQIERHEASAFR